MWLQGIQNKILIFLINIRFSTGYVVHKIKQQNTLSVEKVSIDEYSTLLKQIEDIQKSSVLFNSILNNQQIGSSVSSATT